MILRLYRGIGPGSILLTILSGILVWLYQFINPVVFVKHYSENAMPLFLFFDSLLGDNAFLKSIIAFILVVIIAFYLANFNTRLFFITERTLLPASIYILLSGFFVNLQTLYPVLPATLLLVFAIDRILAAYRRSGVAYNFFDASLMLGLASMFYFNLIWLFPVVIIGILLIRTFNLQEIFLSIFGLISPYLVTGAVYYISGKDLTVLKDQVVNNISFAHPEYLWSPLILVLFCTGALILLLSIIHLVGLFNTKKIRTRKIFSILIWLLVFTLAIYFIVPSSSIELFYIVLIPFTFLVSHFLVFIRNKKIANVVFAIIFLAIVAVQVLRIYGI